MSELNVFSPIQVGPYLLPNRIFMAPMTRNRSPQSIPGPIVAEYYRQRASAGLIITEATQVAAEGQGYPNTPGMFAREQVEGWTQVTAAVHDRGGRIFAQLWHVGRISHPSYQPGGKAPVSSSAIAPNVQIYVPGVGMQPAPVPRALETDEIAGVIEQYRKGAEHALQAGFDGVELHGANGYLIDQFLRDGVNQRQDQYGGSVENRARFALDVTKAVAGVWGPDRVAIRLSPPGTYNDMKDSNPRYTFGYAITELGKLGLAYLHIMEAMEGDLRHGGDLIPASYFRPMFKGVLVTNSGFTLEKANDYIARGYADAIAFGTSFLANPDLPERFRRGAALNTPDAATFYGGTEKGYTDYPTLAG